MKKSIITICFLAALLNVTAIATETRTYKELPREYRSVYTYEDLKKVREEGWIKEERLFDQNFKCIMTMVYIESHQTRDGEAADDIIIFQERKYYIQEVVSQDRFTDIGKIEIHTIVLDALGKPIGPQYYQNFNYIYSGPYNPRDLRIVRGETTNEQSQEWDWTEIIEDLPGTPSNFAYRLTEYGRERLYLLSGFIHRNQQRELPVKNVLTDTEALSYSVNLVLPVGIAASGVSVGSSMIFEALAKALDKYATENKELRWGYGYFIQNDRIKDKKKWNEYVTYGKSLIGEPVEYKVDAYTIP